MAAIELSGLRFVDLTTPSFTWESDGACCDLCRQEAYLFRLLNTTDALCRNCFGMWHG